MIRRRKTRVIKIGSVAIGGHHPVAVQSMLKTKTADTQGLMMKVKDLEIAGCEIIRVAVKDEADARAIRRIKEMTEMPVVADIHFNWKLAIQAIDSGADKIRLNPGNIYKKEQIKEVVRACKQAHIPMRIGLNSGSVGGSGNTVEAMIKKCRDYLKILEGMSFHNLVISLKASNIRDTVEAYRKMALLCDYPFHLGITSTGLPFQGVIKSSIAIGALLLQGIGDTIRVSLTDSPQEEVKAALAILESLGLRNFGPEIISCPTCGRCQVNLVKIVKDFEKALINSMSADRIPKSPVKKYGLRNAGLGPLSVAIMGCEVNGPGEAKHADIGIAFGRGQGLLFKKGKAVKRVSTENCVGELLREIKSSQVLDNG